MAINHFAVQNDIYTVNKNNLTVNLATISHATVVVLSSYRVGIRKMFTLIDWKTDKALSFFFL